MTAAPSNFAFLASVDDVLSRLGALAERYFEDDPATSLIKIRQFGEVLARNTAARLNIPLIGTNQVDVVNALADRGVNPQVIEVLHDVRRVGNRATHDMQGDHQVALRALRSAWHLGTWYVRIAKDRAFRPDPFVPPPSPRAATRQLEAELERLRTELERERQHNGEVELERLRADLERERQHNGEAELVRLRAELDSAHQQKAEAVAYWQSRAAEQKAASARLEAEIEALRGQPPVPTVEEVRQAATAIDAPVDLDEAETRRLIDRQLREAGWEVDTDTLRHAEGARPQKGRNMAIAEWPTEDGVADYVLFVNLTPVAVVEAKRKRIDIAGAVDQARRYSRAYRFTQDETYPGGPWDTYRIPFMLATNGRPYLRQLQEKSGIWFLDGRRPTNHARAVNGWYTPAGLSDLLALDEQQADHSLTAASSAYLDLRPYQLRAIQAVERAVVEGRREMMLAMATGTGKTRTCIGIIYRLLKAKRVRRVLFLVDRSALGEQAHNAFKDVRLEQMQTLDQMYEIKGLADIRPDTTTRVHVATVQGMMRRILFPRDDDPPAPVDQYDLVIVDECHRGYNLDREMSEAELTFRSETDYISKYRRVLDHFDAIKVGLTATPALHTVEIFGKPVFSYSFREAVLDGYLVDEEPPIRIVTALAEDGMHWQATEDMQVYSTRTQAVETITLPDEVNLELDAYNRKVITERFNRTVCGALAEHLDPDDAVKTLVFCVNDLHADLVVRVLKEALDAQWGHVPDDMVMKITGAAERPDERLRLYKNERFPKIAVTVDLLTTGVDVPEIANLVFLRRVNSRILYEQMKGRATRLCPKIGKESFRIFDAVDMTSAIETLTDMRPVVTNPSFSMGELVAELQAVETDEARAQVLDQIVARLQRKKGLLKGESLGQFEAVAGRAPNDLTTWLRQASPAEAAEWFATREGLADLIDGLGSGGTRYILSEHDDVLRRVERGYVGGLRPAEYLDAFSRYVKDHLNEIPALLAVTQRPRDLSRRDLQGLKLALDRAGFTEQSLRSAWRDTTNHDIAASIIGFIRQGALGSPLLPYGERVKKALEKTLAAGSWTPGQRKWLERIGKQLEQETVVDRDALDREPFKRFGGYAQVDREFDGHIQAVLGDLTDRIWSDVEIA